MTYYLNDMGIVCALGGNRSEVAEALFRGCRDGMVRSADYLPEDDCIVGQVRTPLPEIPAEFGHYQCRNSQLLLAALANMRASVDQAIRRCGADRVGVVIGTSTSGIAEGEQAIRLLNETGRLAEEYDYSQQALSSASDFIASYLGINGPCYTVSTACSSGGRALVSARRLLALDLCDAVITGGADSLCGMTIQGFNALETISPEHCNPFSRNRSGINIGEGAALFLMTQEPGEIALLGAGSSSDAHHISAPDPRGAGAIKAMQRALGEAGIAPDAIDYLNLHGTATKQNDAMESCAVAEIFPNGVPCSSTKSLVGHTLGAAGAIEAGFCWLMLNRGDGLLPPHIWDGEHDRELPQLNLVRQGECLVSPAKVCMSNSFAFGGNNISLVIGSI